MGYASETVLGYALRQGLAQGALLLKAKKIDKVLKDPLSPEPVKKALRLSQELLLFADQVPMKRGSAYKTYVDLGRDWVTQVLVASHKDKLEIKPFKFPIMGAFPYKGYFEEEDALREEAELAQKYDVFRRKVPAYSSLGWFSDPLTSNLIRTEYLLIDTLLHELVHLNFYFDDESDFNEAFATWFATKALEDFIKSSKQIEDIQKIEEEARANVQFDSVLNQFIDEIRLEGQAFYATKDAVEKRDNYFKWIKVCLSKYPELKPLEKIEWNNAVVMGFSTYTRLIPAIEAYSVKNNLSYGNFLQEIIKQGPSIVKEIQKHEGKLSSKRCVPSSP